MTDKVVVIDFGSYSTKFGVGGNIQPNVERSIFVTDGDNSKEKHYGNCGVKKISENAAFASKNKQRNSTSSHRINIEDNLIDFFKNTIFNDEYDNILSPSNHPILLSDELLTPKKYKSKSSELLFESFNIPSIYYEISGVLGLYSTSRLNGLIVDAGYEKTSFLAVVQGYHVENASHKINLGGYHLDLYFNDLLRKAGITFHTLSQLENMSAMKDDLLEFKMNGKPFEKLLDDEEINCTKYTLPDGTKLQIGNAKYRTPELLFTPRLVAKETSGIHHHIMNSINKSDVSLRKLLSENITLIGGCTNIGNFGRRLMKELCGIDKNQYHIGYTINWKNKKQRAAAAEAESQSIENGTYEAKKKDEEKLLAEMNKLKNKKKKTYIRIRAPMNRTWCNWIGGSILSEMTSFKKELLITKEKYDEYGKNILYR